MVNTHVFRSKLLASKRKNPFYCVLDSCCGEVRDLSEEKLGMEKSGDYLNYPSSNISLDWRFGSGNLISPPTCLVPTQNAIAVYGMDPINTSPSSSISMADSFSSTVWDHPSSQNLEFCTNSNIQTSASTTNVVSSRNMGSGSLSSVAMEKVLNFGWNPPNSVPNADVFLQTGTAVLFGWNPPNSVPNADVFLQTGTAVLSQNSTQFPTDSPFIEWAARFSCFNSGDFTNVVNPIRISEHLNPYSKGVGIQMLEVPLNNGLDAVSGAQSQKNGSQMTDVVRDYMPVDNGMLESHLTKNGGESGGLLVSSDEGKGGTGALNNEADEPEFGISVQEGQFVSENAGGEPPARALGAKKRKTSCQMDIELDQSKGSPHLSVETVKENVEPKQNGEKNAATIAAKTIGKHSKGGCQKSDAPKEDYIHVRARRGQATNSHSLAERVRREKISERMKYLQDLVPGCSKVTGKAVMLDEIINYVQSLQRQVEVMTMKLAVVNPRLDFNIEALLSKDIFQSQGSTPPTLGFLPDMGMAHPQLHPLQHGFIQVASPSIGNHSDFLRRTSSSQLTPMNRYEEPAPQIKNAWNDELHNVVQMSYSDNGPFNTQELNGSLPPGHMKVEL